MNSVQIIGKIMTVLPVIIQGVEAIYGGGTGDQKKAEVLSIVQGILSGLTGVESGAISDPAAFNTAIGNIVDGIVSILNVTVWAVKK